MNPLSARIALLIIAIPVASVLACGCGASASRDAHPPSTISIPQTDAQAYVRAVRQTLSEYQVIARRAANGIDASFNNCPVVQPRNASEHLPSESRFDVLQRAAIIKAFYPSYLRLARQLAQVPTHDPALRAGRDAVGTLARYYAVLRTSKPDYCHVLVEWQSVGWRKRFDIAQAIGASTLKARQPTRVRQARSALAQAQFRLRRAGVSAEDAQMFTEVAGLPGTTTS